MNLIHTSRYRRDYAVLHGSMLLGGIPGLAAFATYEPHWALLALAGTVLTLFLARFLMRCSKCGKSMLWWSARNSRAGEFFAAIQRLEVCPYCGYSNRGASDGDHTS